MRACTQVRLQADTLVTLKLFDEAGAVHAFTVCYAQIPTEGLKMTEQESMLIANVIRPFALLALFVLVVIPIRMLIWRILPNGRLKRFLFRRIGD
jgi:hypothetical protein